MFVFSFCAVTISEGKLFIVLVILFQKEYFLISECDLWLDILSELLLTVSVTIGISGDKLTSYVPHSILHVSIMSLLILVYLRVGRSGILILSSYDLFHKLEITFVVNTKQF